MISGYVAYYISYMYRFSDIQRWKQNNAKTKRTKNNNKTLIYSFIINLQPRILG